jgi:translocation and assembly module TamA
MRATKTSWKCGRGAAWVIGLIVLCGCAHPPQKLTRHVALRGVRSVSASDILDGLETRRTGWWPFAEKHYYDPVVLERDVRRIEAYLALRGFFSARVVDRVISERPGGRAVDVRLEVDEGPPSRLHEVRVDGLDRLDAALARRLRAGLGLATGQRFDHERYSGARTRLQDELAAAGYAYAKVTGHVEVDKAGHAVRVQLEAAPGPLVRFGAARIEGNGRIPSDKLLHLLTWRRGDRFDPDELVRSRARLFNQRLFASVRLDLPRDPTPEAAVRVRVVPTKLRELRLGAGFGLESKRQEVRLTGRYTIRNFLGGMRVLELKLQPSYVIFPVVWAAVDHGPALVSEVKLSQPDIWATQITVFAALGYELGIQEGYQFHGPKVQLGGERAFFRDRFRTGLSWNLQFLDFFNVKDVFDASSTVLGVGFRDPYRLAWLEEFARLDLRDVFVDPRSGFWAELRLEQGLRAIGGDFNYLKFTPDVRGYLPLGTKRVILALRAQFGYVRPLGSDDSPITRRLSLGGPNSHRGFSFGRLSPQQDGIPYGGNASLLGSADLRLRIWRLFDNWLSLIAFADAGDVVTSFSDLSLSRLHVAVGGSLQYQTPIGAIRIGVGVRLNRLAADTVPQNPDPGSRIAFHLTMGEAF